MFYCDHVSVLYFDVLIQLNIEAQYVFTTFLYAIKHLPPNRQRRIQNSADI